MSAAYDLAGLKELYSLLGDSRKGYDHAAMKAHNPDVALFLVEKSKERARAQEALVAAIRELATELPPLANGGLKGALHREWTGIRVRFRYSDDAVVLDECERGDRYLLERFTAIRDHVRTPRPVRDMLHQYHSHIETQLAQLEQLNDSLLARI